MPSSKSVSRTSRSFRGYHNKSMNIRSIRWQAYSIPLRFPFSTAHGNLNARQGAIVEIETDEQCSGLGEIAPMPEFGGVTLKQALGPLLEVSEMLQGRETAVALDLLYMYADDGRLPASTLCGLESALLDIQGKSQQRASSELLARPGQAIKRDLAANFVIGMGSIEKAIDLAVSAQMAGFRCVKIKMGDGGREQIQRVAAIREALGPNMHIRLDANACWSFEQAVHVLRACEPYDIQYIEQPLAVSNLTGMYWLRHAVAIPIAADEAVYDLASARCILDAQAAEILILKPQFLGGIRNSRRIIEEASRRGVQCVITSAIEAGIGIAGTMQLVAASPEITLESGLMTLYLLEHDLLKERLEITEDGGIRLPSGAGLGVELDREALETRLYRERE